MKMALPVSSAFYGTYLDTDATIKTEFELVNRYRDMALQAELKRVDDIVNEAIVTSHEVPVRINLDNINISDNIKKINQNIKRL